LFSGSDVCQEYTSGLFQTVSINEWFLLLGFQFYSSYKRFIEVTGDWRKLHNEELHNFYSSPNIIRMSKSRRMRWAGHVARRKEKRSAYGLLVGKPEGKRPLGRPRRR
jgi:hypothetical protein